MTQTFNFSFGNATRWETANCANTIFPDLFFPESAQEEQDSGQTIKAMCSTCPMKAKCLQVAIDNRDFYGYWGGMSGDERRRLSERQGRVNRGTSREVIRLLELGLPLQQACDEARMNLKSFIKNNPEYNPDKDN